MIQNRFFKTTVGVPFEFIPGLIAALGGTRTTYKTFLDTTPVVGDYGAFVVDGTKLNKTLTMGTAITTAQKKFPVYFSVLRKVTAGVGEPLNTTPLLGESIRAEVVAYKAPAFQSAKVTLASGTPAVSQSISFKIIETTPGNNPLPIWDYTLPITVDVPTTVTAIVAAATADVENDNWTVTALTAPDGINVVSKDATRHFRLAVSVNTSASQPIDASTWTYTVNTAPSAGSGTVAHLRQLEYEDNVRRGITAQYPAEGFASAEFGAVVSMIDAIVAAGTTTFDLVVITGVKTEISPTPIERHHNVYYIFLAVPAGQGAAIGTTFA